MSRAGAPGAGCAALSVCASYLANQQWLASREGMLMQRDRGRAAGYRRAEAAAIRAMPDPPAALTATAKQTAPGAQARRLKTWRAWREKMDRWIVVSAT